ncbi:MAG: hypothetical protein KBT20_00825 [Bacteroidales bacterium]|nr:hypothetical protein [Candidatus Liminaster caballi]
MDHTQGGPTGRDRQTVSDELTTAQQQLDRLLSSLRPGSHPCDRSETGYQLKRLTARISELKQELKTL